jgi:hypothetical protein
MINKVKVYHKLTVKVMEVVVSYAALTLQIEDMLRVDTCQCGYIQLLPFY